MILRVFRFFRIAVFAILLVVLLTSLVVNMVLAKEPSVVVLKVKGIINPVMADYLERGILEAENTGAVACIVQIDTPGGLDTAMRDMVQDIVNAKVPVVVYVSPSGARAASAGVFITVSAHIAAMAPNTAIGAASPVSIGSGGEQEISETMREKVMNDAAAYIRSLAGTRGRNVDWAEKAVREAVSATETEALDLKVIDIVSRDLNTLLKDINGREIVLASGAKAKLDTGSVVTRFLDMTWTEELLLAISDPNVAFILLGLAGIGLWVEITNPGLIFPGVFGGISLIFALFSLGNLPVNIAGILLIALAFILFIIEALVVPGFGAAGIGGIISLVIGALILFKGGPMFQVSPWLIAVVAICVAAFFTFIIYKLTKLRQLKPQTGYEEMVDETVTVREALAPEGVIFYRGELWTAVSEEGRVEAGEAVIIKRVDGLKLFVTREKKEGNK
ncbi:MAG: nodulation protein NfeD [Dehalococcoidia bacterium]|nr:nodulation protein NfeD [Dehalococcoidia bacterium]